ncbi:MAG: efflux RND transporter periplasmic adaptor subunit [Bacteroidia bacterium]|nr:efflux RND transporter periplasmic adaptor subunit [Bacteroidia bacterium]
MKKLIYIIPAFALLYSCSSEAPKETAKESVVKAEQEIMFTPAQMKNANVQVGTPELKDLSGVVRANGVVDVPPQNLVSVSFPLGGYLRSTDLLPGARVKRGQVIAVMEDVSYIQMQEEFLVVASQMEMQKKELARQRTLNESKASSDKNLEQAQAEYSSLEARHSGLRQKLLLIGINPDKLTASAISGKVNIYSPIDGYVSDVLVNVGMYLNPSDVLFELVNPNDLHIALTVFEKDLPMLQTGQKIRFNLTSDPSHTFEGEVVLVGRKLDENRSAEVHCHFDAEDKDVIPGMFVTGEIEVTKANSLCVPEGAVVRLADAEYIYVQKSEGTFQRAAITSGIERDGWIEILTSEIDLKESKLITANAWSALMLQENTGE